MMPELGKYAATVLAAYGVTLACLALFVIWTLIRGLRAKQRLADAEQSRTEATPSPNISQEAAP